MREFIPVAGEGNSTVGHFQGDYFFYHHSQGDMPDILDSKQLDRASMLWALFAYIVADLPTLLPRIDTSYVQQLCLIPGSDGAVDTVCLIREISKIVSWSYPISRPNRFPTPVQEGGNSGTHWA